MVTLAAWSAVVVGAAGLIVGWFRRVPVPVIVSSLSLLAWGLMDFAPPGWKQAALWTALTLSVVAIVVVIRFIGKQASQGRR